jgi:DNA polymerase-3 subunit delta
MTIMPPAAASPPQVYLFYGDDAQQIADCLAALEAEFSRDPSLAELNLARLDFSDRRLNEEQLQAAAYSLPFLSDRRLVIVRNPFAYFRAAETCQRLVNLLEGLPPSTTLALAVADEQQGGKKGWEVMDDGKRGKIIRAWAGKAGSRAVVKELRLPRPQDMTYWIVERAKQEGGQIHPRAAAELAALTGNETGIAVQEIRKLLLYVNYARPIEVEDVQEAAASGGVANIFALLDAIEAANPRAALKQLKLLLDEEDPAYIFGMIVRQYRLMIIAREALDQGVSPIERLRAFRVSEKAAEILAGQSRRASLTKLESIYRQLLATDQMIKSGQSDPQAAIQTLVVQLSNR